jgi:hypothetical protein
MESCQGSEERFWEMDEFDKLAIQTAHGVLAAHIESPGSQELRNVEAAKQILERCRGLLPFERAEHCIGEDLAQ